MHDDDDNDYEDLEITIARPSKLYNSLTVYFHYTCGQNAHEYTQSIYNIIYIYISLQRLRQKGFV